MAGVCLAGWIAGRATPGATAVSWHGGSRRVETLRDGAEAPAFTLKDGSGLQVSLGDFRGAPLALVFTSPDCPFCKDLAKRMVGVRFKTGVAVRFISSGAGTSPELASAHGEHGVLLDPTGAVGTLYGIPAVPTVYLIDAEGRVSSAGVGMPSAWNRLQALTLTAQAP